MISDILSTGSTADVDEYVPSSAHEEIEGCSPNGSKMYSRILNDAHGSQESQRAYNSKTWPTHLNDGQKAHHNRSPSGQVYAPRCSSAGHDEDGIGQKPASYRTNLQDELKGLQKAGKQLDYVSLTTIAWQICTQMCELHEKDRLMGAVRP